MIRDSRDIQVQRLLMENTRLTNELIRVQEYCSLLEIENSHISDERSSVAIRIEELENVILTNESIIVELQETKRTLESIIEEQKKEIESLRECLHLSKETEFDLQSVINIMRNRQFNTNSDATRFMNGQIDILDPTLNTIGLEDLAEALQRKLNEAIREVDKDTSSTRPLFRMANRK